MSYSIEYAKSNRSKCKGPKKTCPSEDRSIKMGELRFGVEVESGSFKTTSWKHWACVTPKVIQNMQEKLSGPEEIEGWESLKEEDEKHIRLAWEKGEIPEDDKPQLPKEEGAAPEEPKKKRKSKEPKETPQKDTQSAEEKPAKKARAPRANKKTSGNKEV